MSHYDAHHCKGCSACPISSTQSAAMPEPSAMLQLHGTAAIQGRPALSLVPQCLARSLSLSLCQLMTL
eukprot:4803531-Amphidinium_carterae.2